ncbi:MAG TPA: hypothetical protein VD978_33120 [Azospirillum sp.]|nr:hypothetical protein [Azospirillum sp.]
MLGIAAMSLTACQTTGSGPTAVDAANEKAPMHQRATSAVNLAELVVSEKGGLLDRMWNASRAKRTSASTHQEFFGEYVLPFTSLEAVRGEFASYCGRQGGTYQWNVCWAPNRSNVMFVAEIYTTKRRDTFDKLGINVLERAPAASPEQFFDATVNQYAFLETIRFTTTGQTRFAKLQQTAGQYDQLSSDVRATKLAPYYQEAELPLVAKAIHDALTSAKGNGLYELTSEVFGTVGVKDRFEKGAQRCATIRLYRQDGVKPSFSRQLSNIMTDETGRNVAIHTVCTGKEDALDTGWRFAS